MSVRENGYAGFGYESVLIGEDPCGTYHVLQRGAGDVIADVSDKVYRPSEDGLCTEAGVVRVEAAIFKHADVVNTAVGLDEVVGHIEDIVAVYVDRHTLFTGFRQAMGIDAD